MLKFISNATQAHGHENTLKLLLKNADEVFISVAYLKTTGLDRIRSYLKTQTRFKIIAGANFGLTDPQALTDIMGHMGDGRVEGYLNSMKSRRNFHPKMYLARKGKRGRILIGSANLTAGGLDDNNECSVYYECPVDDKMWEDAFKFFRVCIDPANCHVLTTPIIKEYSEYHQKQKDAEKQRKKFPQVGTFLTSDIERLKRYLNNEGQAKLAKEFSDKKARYEKAYAVVEQIRTSTHPPAVFKSLIEQLVGYSRHRGLWYSNGMFRHKGKLFDEQKGFRRLISVIHDNIDQSPAVIFDEARRVSKEVKGAGPNFIGEIMMTYAPDRLANINQNPITALREEVKIDIKRSSSSYNGKEYEEYNKLVKELGDKLGLTSMLKMDYFFNLIFQDLKKAKPAK